MCVSQQFCKSYQLEKQPGGMASRLVVFRSRLSWEHVLRHGVPRIFTNALSDLGILGLDHSTPKALTLKGIPMQSNAHGNHNIEALIEIADFIDECSDQINKIHLGLLDIQHDLAQLKKQLDDRGASYGV